MNNKINIKEDERAWREKDFPAMLATEAGRGAGSGRGAGAGAGAGAA